MEGGQASGGDPGASRSMVIDETFTGHFFWISLRRAFRLRIRNEEVLPQERRHLETQAAHVTDPDQQSFLAWRRSVLLLVAMMFVPLTVFRFLESFGGPARLTTTGQIFRLLPAIAEAAFCAVAFAQLGNWAQWKRQRRILFYAWGIYFLAPFLVYLYPFRGSGVAELGEVNFLMMKRSTKDLIEGLSWGLLALLHLGPKVISLMPGLIRASIVTKSLFPGTTAPGWLMMLAAPFYALFAYIIVLMPYQLTGSWEFVVGNVGILLAQVFIAYSGRRLTVPLTAEQSAARISRSWVAYIAIMVVSLLFMVYGFADMVRELHMGWVSITTGILAFASNILLDTLVGTDAIVAAMAHLRRHGPPDPAQEQLLRDAEHKLGKFVT